MQNLCTLRDKNRRRMNINEETVRGLSLLVIDNSISQVLEKLEQFNFKR